jgi:DNA-directed RNA polymerase subunit RPC12/RpoP
MAVSTRYRCLNCGERFACEVLSRDEVYEARRQGRYLPAVHCPQCKRTDLERVR